MRFRWLIVALTLVLVAPAFAQSVHAQAQPEPVLRSSAPPAVGLGAGMLNGRSLTDPVFGDAFAAPDLSQGGTSDPRGVLHAAAATSAPAGRTDATVIARAPEEDALPISDERSEPRRFSLLKHVLVGAGIGLMAGGALGVKADLECMDCMLPLTPFAAAGGAVAGALGGLLVWGMRTTSEEGRTRE